MSDDGAVCLPRSSRRVRRVADRPNGVGADPFAKGPLADGHAAPRVQYDVPSLHAATDIKLDAADLDDLRCRRVLAHRVTVPLWDVSPLTHL